MINSTTSKRQATCSTNVTRTCIDYELVTKYFNKLGYQADDTIYLRALPAKGHEVKCAGEKLQVQLSHLHSLHLDQYISISPTPLAVYSIPNGGHSDKDITSGRAFFFEWDDITKEMQWEKVKALDLLSFISFAVETRKSIHFYIVLDTPCAVDQWKALQTDLLEFTGSDKALKNPSRLMRAAGFLHLQKDCEPFPVNFVYESNRVISYSALRSFIPTGTQSTKKRKNSSSGSSTGTTLEALVQKAQQHQYKKQLKPTQIQQLLCDAQERLAGISEGGRNDAMFSIGCELGRQLLFGVPAQDAYTALCAGAAACGLEAWEYEPTALRALDTGADNTIDTHPDQVSDELAKSFVIEQPDQFVHQRFIGELPFNGKQHIILKSQKGTGKTTALLALMERLRKEGIKTLLIGHRCVLLNQSSHNLNLSYYGDVAGSLNSQDSLAITLDSLHRIDTSKWKNCVVLLDEASQVLRHLTGDTAVKQTRRACLDTLRFLITNSAHTIMLDADMSSVEIDFLTRVVPRESINVVVNTQLPTQRKFIQHNSQACLVNYVIEQLKQGKNVYIPSNSKEVVEVIERTINQQLPDISSKAITSKNSDCADIQLFVRDINNQVEDVQVLLASPSLGTGVDINVQHFDVVCAFMTNGSQCSATDVMQHIARVRDIKTNEVHIWVKGGMTQVDTDADVLRDSIEYATQPDLYCINKTTGKREPVDAELHDLYVWLYCSVTARHNASVRNLQRSLLKLIHAEGHMFDNYVVDDADAAAQTKAQLKQTKAQLKQESIAAIVNAPAITEKQLAQLKDEQHLTSEQQASVEQYFIRRNCGVDTVTQDLVEWYEDKGKTGIRNYIDTYIKPMGLLTERDYRDRLDVGAFTPDQRKQAAACKLRRKLIPQDILNGAVFSHDSLRTSGWVELAQENAEAMKALLGITFSTTKPVQAMTALLGQLGLDVESLGKVRVGGTEKATTYIGVSENVPATSVPVDGKRVRLYAVTSESLERMAGIVERTNDQLTWKWYEFTVDAKNKLSHQQQDSTGTVALRINNLEAVMTELQPQVKQRLEAEQRWLDEVEF